MTNLAGPRESTKHYWRQNDGAWYAFPENTTDNSRYTTCNLTSGVGSSTSGVGSSTKTAG